MLELVGKYFNVQNLSLEPFLVINTWKCCIFTSHRLFRSDRFAYNYMSKKSCIFYIVSHYPYKKGPRIIGHILNMSCNKKTNVQHVTKSQYVISVWRLRALGKAMVRLCRHCVLCVQEVWSNFHNTTWSLYCVHFL